MTRSLLADHAVAEAFDPADLDMMVIDVLMICRKTDSTESRSTNLISLHHDLLLGNGRHTILLVNKRFVGMIAGILVLA